MIGMSLKKFCERDSLFAYIAWSSTVWKSFSRLLASIFELETSMMNDVSKNFTSFRATWRVWKINYGFYRMIHAPLIDSLPAVVSFYEIFCFFCWTNFQFSSSARNYHDDAKVKFKAENSMNGARARCCRSRRWGNLSSWMKMSTLLSLIKSRPNRTQFTITNPPTERRLNAEVEMTWTNFHLFPFALCSLGLFLPLFDAREDVQLVFLEDESTLRNAEIGNGRSSWREW